MRARPRIVFVGAATVDMILRVDALPEGGGKVLPNALVEAAHGMATSAAASAARLGADALLIARIGDDAVGDRFVSEIEREGVDCRYVRRSPGVRTPLSAVIVDASGERLVVPYYDPGLGRDASWLPLDEIARADATLVDVRWPQAAAIALDAARRAGKPAVLDADVGPVETIVDLASRSTHAVFSEPAALAVSGAATVADAVTELARRFDAFVAMTAGAQGCSWLEDGAVRTLAPPEVVAVDTLAAGDVFHGAFTLALAEGRAIAEAIRFANIAAALKCAVFGGRLGAPHRATVDQFERDNAAPTYTP